MGYFDNPSFFAVNDVSESDVDSILDIIEMLKTKVNIVWRDESKVTKKSLLYSIEVSRAPSIALYFHYNETRNGWNLSWGFNELVDKEDVEFIIPVAMFIEETLEAPAHYSEEFFNMLEG